MSQTGRLWSRYGERQATSLPYLAILPGFGLSFIELFGFFRTFGEARSSVHLVILSSAAGSG